MYYPCVVIIVFVVFLLSVCCLCLCRAHVSRDKRSLMTMIFKSASSTHRSRPLDDACVAVIEQGTNRLLNLDDLREEEDDEEGRMKKQIELEKSMLLEYGCVNIRSDIMDTHIYICTPEVLMLFTDNFDYQEMRKDFVRGVLGSEILV